MTSTAQAAEAPLFAQRQRLDLAQLLRVNADGAAPADMDLANQVIAAGARGDGATYDALLASAAVNNLFARGVLFVAGGQR